MLRRPPRSTLSSSSAASDVYKRQDNQVTVEQVRRQLAEDYPLAAVPFDDYVEKSDVLEPAMHDQPVTVTPARIRRMESRSIHTANGIEVKIPTEMLSEDSAVEFLHDADGSVSLLIKNVILSLIHISEPTRRTPISYAVFCLKKKKIKNKIKKQKKKKDTQKTK